MTEMSSLSIGLSGLDASQEALNLVGQNITNAATPGYVDEQASLQTLFGGGVAVAGIDRLSDLPLQSQVLDGQSAGQSLAAQQSGVASIQQLFPEPAGTGAISTALTSYWADWNAVAGHPGDASARSLLIAQGRTVATALQQAATGIGAVAQSADAQLAPAVSTVNTLTGQIAALNRSIVETTAAGRPDGHLADQRDALVSQLSSQIGVRVSLQSDGSETIYAGNGALVVGGTSQAIDVSTAGTPAAITWAADGGQVAVSGGTIGGLLQTLNTTVPAYSAALDSVASTLITSVNTAQAKGIDLTGNAGAPFFSGTGASSIAVALTGTDQIAAASGSAPIPTVPGDNLDGTNAAAIADLATAAQGPDATYSTFVGQLGSAVAQVNAQVGAQTQMTNAATASYQARTGVDTNQELTEMVQYQNAYSAAAKYVSTVDQTMQTLLQIVA